MPNVPMRFGAGSATGGTRPGIKYITGGEISDDTTVTLTFEPGGMYVLYCKEFNTSTGAYRGHRAMLIAAPEDEVFGTVAVGNGNMYASGNSGVTITNVADSTVTIKQNNAAYSFRYALYRVF